MTRDTLNVALVSEVFHQANGPERLVERLREARRAGADLAVLPELPLNTWCAVRRTASAADAEAPGGPRQRAQARAAREAGLALLGGAIVQDPESGRRRNAAMLFDASGEVVSRYDKLHLPREEGFWETAHYEPGEALPRPIALDGFAVAVQICSDVNRPEPTHILGALGALAVLAPRATPPGSYERWRLVLRANAVTSCLYVVSVNRPEEAGTLMGGASLAVGPGGEVLMETRDALVVVPLRRQVVEAARTAYPGYLPVRSGLYARGWSRAAAEQREATDPAQQAEAAEAAKSPPQSRLPV